jgi:hypothetical protein
MSRGDVTDRRKVQTKGQKKAAAVDVKKVDVMNRATEKRAIVSQGDGRNGRGVDPEIMIPDHLEGSEIIDAKDRVTQESTIADTERETST